MDNSDRDMKSALETLPRRGLLSWLREWAEGNRCGVRRERLPVPDRQQKLPDADQAKVIPTTGGMRALRDKNIAFLDQEDGIEIEDAVFVAPDFLGQRGVEEISGGSGSGISTRSRNSMHVLRAYRARRATTNYRSSGTPYSDCPSLLRLRPLSGRSATVKVPTRDGGWAWPKQVLDLIEPLTVDTGSFLLDVPLCAGCRVLARSDPRARKGLRLRR